MVAIKRRLVEALEFGQLTNSREAIFGWRPTAFPQIPVLQKSFEMCVSSPVCGLLSVQDESSAHASNPVFSGNGRYATLWDAAADFQRSFPQWMDGPFIDLNAEVRVVVLLLWTSLLVSLWQYCSPWGCLPISLF